ncbi:hypothetical protein MMC27_007275 [Xylographa pallens]|nr:hypothetical protein [Xylographa pallens]
MSTAGNISTAYGPIDFGATSFSINLFSAQEDDSSFQYHHAAPTIATAMNGTKIIDIDTVYRLGSVTKMLTVWLFLIKAGDVHFNQPITQYVPELLTAAESENTNVTETGNNVDFVRWSDVTIGELASHMAGLDKELTFADLSDQPEPWTALGLPPLSPADMPNCSATLSGSLCGREAFLNYLVKQHPAFPTSTTPIYSNIAFQILAYALENITNSTFESMFNDGIVQPLNLTHTTYTQPQNDSYSVIPSNPTTSWYNVNFGDEGPAGGVYSSTHDLSQMGRAILKSALLSSAQTRRWLKPVAHTATTTTSVGRPWEIQRITGTHVTDLYTKPGDVGLYATQLVLSPDYAFGFTVMAAGQNTIPIAQLLSDMLVARFLPAIALTAAQQAGRAFLGTYSAPPGSINSSIALVDDGMPGLRISRWISNGTDLLAGIFAAYTGIRLYPTGATAQSLLSPAGGTFFTDRVAYRAVYESVPKVDNSSFADQCNGWEDFVEEVYGGVSANEFVFHLDAVRGVVGLEPRALRVVLVRGVEETVGEVVRKGWGAW